MTIPRNNSIHNISNRFDSNSGDSVSPPRSTYLRHGDEEIVFHHQGQGSPSSASQRQDNRRLPEDETEEDDQHLDRRQRVNTPTPSARTSVIRREEGRINFFSPCFFSPVKVPPIKEGLTQIQTKKDRSSKLNKKSEQSSASPNSNICKGCGRKGHIREKAPVVPSPVKAPPIKEGLTQNQTKKDRSLKLNKSLNRVQPVLLVTSVRTVVVKAIFGEKPMLPLPL
jgi:hypothetical protein